MFKDVTEGKVVDTFKAMVEAMFKGAATAKGALSITPEKVIVTTPGADKKRTLAGRQKSHRSSRFGMDFCM